MHRTTIPLLIASLATVPPAYGQLVGAGDSAAAAHPKDLSALERGARVRVTAPSLSLEREVGTFGAVRGDTLFIGPAQFGESVRAVPLSAVTRLEVSEGRKSHAKLGAGIGAVAGLVAGIALAPSPEKETCDLDQEGLDCLAPDFGAATEDLMVALATVTVATLAGAGAGALVGSAIKTERWAPIESVDLDLSVTVRDGGLGLAVSSRW